MKFQSIFHCNPSLHVQAPWEASGLNPFSTQNAHLIDIEIFLTLQAAIGRESMNEVLARLETQIRDRFHDLAQPPEELSAHAHDLLNSAGMIGLIGFAAACRTLHDTIRAKGDHEQQLANFAKIKARTLDLVASLRSPEQT